MQFLSDVYLRCPDCDGRRYRPEVLEVKLRGTTSIADVLDLTVTEAVVFFSDRGDIKAALEPLLGVGLGYLKLGQPVPTLSGGEAQRLKLAGHLAWARKKKGGPGRLLLFDEPTTGLHFADIAVLLTAFRRLIADGHSLVVIEHNLDVIRAADWVIDLGPEGGDAGGSLVCAGTPADVAACEESRTGAALREIIPGAPRRAAERAGGGAQRQDPAARTVTSVPPRNEIVIRHAREHNLKGVDVTIPRDRFTVITGVSGSGKSTVATQTEIAHFLRLLYARLGTQYCPECDVPITPQSIDAIAAGILKGQRGRRVALLAPLVIARKGYYTDLAAWAAKQGFRQLRVDGAQTPTVPWPRLDRFREHTIELPVAELAVSSRAGNALRSALKSALGYGKGVVHLLPAGAPTPEVFSSRRACPSCGRGFPEPDPRLFSHSTKHGWCPACYGTGLAIEGFDAEQTGEEIWWNQWYEGSERACPACAGRRLRPEALAVRFAGRGIAAVLALPVESVETFIGSLKLDARAAAIARDLLAEVGSRLAFLRRVGLGYLQLDRAAPTLSGGEAQRIKLVTELAQASGAVLYLLDEPTVGLHMADIEKLIRVLHRLVDGGNTVVVVEHNLDVIAEADWLIDLGPEGGVAGGRVVATGPPAAVALRGGRSHTARYLAPFLERRKSGEGEKSRG